MISEGRESAIASLRSRGAGFPLILRWTVRTVALVIYTLLFAELFVRVFDPQPVMPRYITGTAWGVRGNIPNARYWHHTPEVDVEYRINAQGLRADRVYPLAKPPGTCRIGIFGDSFLFGVEVDLRDSFAGRLEGRLRQAGIPVEVLNFSVGGFGTAEMLQTYEQFGRHFDLDAVIFSWDISDLGDNVRSDLFRLKAGALERAHAEYLPGVSVQDRLMQYRLYRLVADHSQLYSFVRERISVLLKNRLTLTHKQSLALADAGDSEGASQAGKDDMDEIQHRDVIDLSAAILLRAHDVVTSSGEDFYVMDLPTRQSRTEFASTIGILPAPVRSRIKIISPLAAMSAAARPGLKLYYERGQGHFTPAGVGILVDEAAKALASSARLASCAAEAASASAAGSRAEH